MDTNGLVAVVFDSRDVSVSQRVIFSSIDLLMVGSRKAVSGVNNSSIPEMCLKLPYK